MRYLLDTHVVIWWLMKPAVLPPRLVALLKSPSNSFLLSIASPWEMAIKTGNGKLDVLPILRDLEAGKFRETLTILPAEVSQVVRAGLLPLHHRDPFDRLLAAQALDLRLSLISRDTVFDLYGVKRIWD